MTGLQLQEIKERFNRYAGTFAAADGTLHPFLQLKVDHSQRVADNARQLAEDLGWNPSEANCAEAVGWLHDIGRFSQFAEFGTFTDATSVNHGERGWEVVRESNVLSALPPAEQEILLAGIRYHNARVEPDHLNKESLRFLKLIRDADKLDILQFVLTAVQRDGFQDLPRMLPQVVLDGPINPELIDEILAHRSCSIEKVRSLADFLLMQLSWVYDLNYSAALKRVSELSIVDRVESFCSENQKVGQIVQEIRSFMEQKLT